MALNIITTFSSASLSFWKLYVKLMRIALKMALKKTVHYKQAVHYHIQVIYIHMKLDQNIELKSDIRQYFPHVNAIQFD